MNYTGQIKRVQLLHQLKATRFIAAQRECFDLSETSSAEFWISPLHTRTHGAAEREDEHVVDTCGLRLVVRNRPDSHNIQTAQANMQLIGLKDTY